MGAWPETRRFALVGLTETNRRGRVASGAAATLPGRRLQPRTGTRLQPGVPAEPVARGSCPRFAGGWGGGGFRGGGGLGGASLSLSLGGVWGGVSLWGGGCTDSVGCGLTPRTVRTVHATAAQAFTPCGASANGCWISSSAHTVVGAEVPFAMSAGRLAKWRARRDGYRWAALQAGHPALAGLLTAVRDSRRRGNSALVGQAERGRAAMAADDDKPSRPAPSGTGDQRGGGRACAAVVWFVAGRSVTVLGLCLRTLPQRPSAVMAL